MRVTLLAAALMVAGGCTPQSNVVPKSSGSIAISLDDKKLFVVDADHDLLTVIDTQTRAVLGQTAVGKNPERVLVAPSGDVYVSNRGSRSVTRLSPDGLHVEVTATVGAEPVGLAMSATGGQVLVANSMSGTVLALDAKTLETKAELAVGGQPFALAPLGDNRRVYVTDFNGGTVRVVDLQTRNVVSTITLEQPTSAECARGTVPARTPAQTADVILSPDGERAYVAHVQSRVGTAGLMNSLNFAVAPALSTIGTLNDQAMAELTPADATAPARPTFPSPILATNVSQECANVTRAPGMDAPSSLVVDGMGEWIFVADHNSNAVAVVSAVRRTDATFRVPDRGIADVVRVGARPTGIAVSGDLTRAYVHNALDYSVSFIEKQPDGHLMAVATVGIGKSDLPADVERGRKLFYSAVDPRLTQPELGGVSCSSCHPNGRADGLSWVLPPERSTVWPAPPPTFGSKRNTPPLWGVGKTAPYHWDGTISDLPAFNTAMVTQMGGAGVSTRDLGDLGAYLATIETPDNPNVGRAAPGLVARGSQLFQERCSTCHAGATLTDGKSHLVAASDVTKLDTPSLRGVFATAPYLHDGSAAALGDVLKTRGIADHDQRALSPADLEALQAFVEAQ